jgi:cell wall assembly regulator SMI1
MSERDKKLLMVLGVALIGLLLYYAVYRPITNKKYEVEQELITLEERATILRTEFDKMAFYKEETIKANERIGTIQETLPAELSQERAFKLLFDIEDQFKSITFGTVTFSNIETLAYSNELSDATTQMAISQNIVSNLELSYSDLKSFMRYIYSYPDRTVLTNLSMNLLEEENKIGITLVMNMYGLAGAGREGTTIEFENVPRGKSQPFDSPQLNVGQAPAVTSHPTDGTGDLFISLKPTQSDGYAQVVGLTGDASQKSYVSADVENTVQGIIKVYVENGKYYANYDMNGVYKERQSFDVGTALELDLYSYDRIDSTDKVAMNLTIINQTELPLYVNKIEEDLNAPRLNIVSTEGQVVK